MFHHKNFSSITRLQCSARLSASTNQAHVEVDGREVRNFREDVEPGEAFFLFLFPNIFFFLFSFSRYFLLDRAMSSFG